jgi:hypothetical protein
MNLIRSIFSTALLSALVFSPAAYSQCKGFAKKTCLPKVAPYTHNGQLNSANLLSGQKVQLEMTFYSGQNYRLLVCAQEALGKVDFKLLDSDKNVIFSSKDNGSPDHWDFNLKSTQQLFIEVDVPKIDAPNGITPSGCVALLVGFKN